MKTIVAFGLNIITTKGDFSLDHLKYWSKLDHFFLPLDLTIPPYFIMVHPHKIQAINPFSLIISLQTLFLSSRRALYGVFHNMFFFHQPL